MTGQPKQAAQLVESASATFLGPQLGGHSWLGIIKHMCGDIFQVPRPRAALQGLLLCCGRWCYAHDGQEPAAKILASLALPGLSPGLAHATFSLAPRLVLLCLSRCPPLESHGLSPLQ